MVLKSLIFVSAVFLTVFMTNKLIGSRKDDWFHLRLGAKLFGKRKPSQSLSYGLPKTWHGLTLLGLLAVIIALQFYMVFTYL